MNSRTIINQLTDREFFDMLKHFDISRFEFETECFKARKAWIDEFKNTLKINTN